MNLLLALKTCVVLLVAAGFDFLLSAANAAQDGYEDEFGFHYGSRPRKFRRH